MSLDAEAPFAEPWQARLFALTQGLIEGGGLDREEFRQALIGAVAEDRARPYWESWLAALESALSDREPVS